MLLIGDRGMIDLGRLSFGTVTVGVWDRFLATCEQYIVRLSYDNTHIMENRKIPEQTQSILGC